MTQRPASVAPSQQTCIAAQVPRVPAVAKFWHTPAKQIQLGSQSAHCTPSNAVSTAHRPAMQSSGGSQGPVPARQTVVGGATAFVGQVALVPEQTSAGSQTPFAARQTTPAGEYEFIGQSTPPAQLSALSQAPPAGLQG
jgi:hypothetical protein